MESPLKQKSSVFTALVRSEIRNRYQGSFLGPLWMFVMPLINLAIIWFAIQMGFKTSNVDGIPFIFWLMTGSIPWVFFADSVSGASSSIVEKSFLVKKVVFDVAMLPAIKIFASLTVFTVLFTLMTLVLAFSGYPPNIYWLQLPYYVTAMLALALSLGWLTSSIVVFYRDLGVIIAVALQLGFWITPVFWTPSHLPPRFLWIVEFNPVNFVIGGFRSAFFNHTWFWEYPLQNLLFWVLVFVLSAAGAHLFRRLRHHFADVL